MPGEVAAGDASQAGAEAPGAEAAGLPSDADVVAALGKETPAEGAAPGAAAGATAAAGGGEDVAKPADKPQTPKESAVLRSLQTRERDLLDRKRAFHAQQAQAEASIDSRVKAGVEAALRERFKDPRAGVKALSELGIKDQEIADALLHKDAPTADELARKAIADGAALKKQLADRDAAAARAKNESEFTQLAKRMGEKGDLKFALEEWNETELVAETYKLIAELQTECETAGRPVPTVSDERLLRALDRRAKAKHDWRAERQKARTGADDTKTKAAGQPDTKAADHGSGHQGGQTEATATSTTTLGKGLGERQTVNVPDPVLMSNDDIVAAVNKKVSEGFMVKAR